MKKAEVERKFDEIVDFSGVEKFIDTPVKRYSSGMKVRLAFAVAAHLEPEILLVDEVLAVGDAAFQKKCLGKIGEVVKEGRTVLFVSHNVQALQSLCGYAFHLAAGKITNFGDVRSVVAQYLARRCEMNPQVSWPEKEMPGNEEIRIKAIRVYSENGDFGGAYRSSQNINIEIDFIARSRHSALCIGFDLMTSQGETVLRSYQTDMSSDDRPSLHLGENVWRCVMPKGLLNAGTYYLCPKIGMHNMYWIVNLDAAIQFEVILDHGVSPFWNVLNGGNRPGIIAPVLKWDSPASK
jgi:lipopolysaccharide transport system ATP-binding protein